ncbi:MAG: hypothetical protein B7Z37_03165 [Verrucomicrobia bacterium 12-59-8]|nr:MAG: hypothetical protein B7Z37_03165 [Verrucomicrobia bacterium 12-59-8]
MMMLALTGPGAMAQPMAPMARSTVPGLIPPKGQGAGGPALNAQQILQLMAMPKLQGKMR